MTMNTIIARHVSKTTGLAMLGATGLLLFLQILFSYIGQLGELKANYHALDALQYILWESPRYLYELLPIAALIGAVVGLGALASNSELVIMRSAGISLWRIVGWVLRPALLLMLASLAMSEWVLPYSSEQANAVRSDRSGRLGEVRGYWAYDQGRYVYIEYANSAGQLRNVQVIKFDQEKRLQSSLRAESGHYLQQNGLPQNGAQGQNWQLNNTQTAQVQPDGSMQLQHRPTQSMALNLQPRFVHVVTVLPEELAPSQLWRYMQYLNQQGHVPAAYRLAFWQKLSAPFALASLVIIACSFIFGPLRQQSVGFRLVVALFVGLGFRYLQDFLGYASLIYAVSTGWFVVLPIVIVTLVGAYALRRMR